MEILCPNCKSAIADLNRFRGLIDGHCSCGERIQLSIDYTVTDLIFELADGINVDYNKTEKIFVDNQMIND